jgi:hypothetical protein
MRIIQVAYCEIAQEHHDKKKRQYAHVGHYPDVICVCKEFFDLPKKIKKGILYHEISHIYLNAYGTEKETDEFAKVLFGVHIKRINSKYGKNLESL